MANAMLIEPLAMTLTAPGGSAAGFDPAVMANDLLGVIWQAPVAATASIQIDLGSDVAVTALVLLGLGGALTGATATVQMATSAQGAGMSGAWSDSARAVLAGAKMPVSGLGKMLWIAPAGAPAAARYIRISFAGLGTMVPLQIGRAVAGAYFQPERNFSFGAVRGVRPLGNVDFSVYGVPLVRRGAKLRTLGIAFNSVYRDEAENVVQPLVERCGIDAPLVIVTDPAAHAQRQNRIYFGYLTGSPGTVQARAKSYQADFALVALD